MLVVAGAAVELIGAGVVLIGDCVVVQASEILGDVVAGNDGAQDVGIGRELPYSNLFAEMVLVKS